MKKNPLPPEPHSAKDDLRGRVEVIIRRQWECAILIPRSSREAD